MSDKTLTFHHKGHVTKRTFRFEEVDDAGIVLDKVDAVVGSIYIKKKVFEEGSPPASISLKIEW